MLKSNDRCSDCCVVWFNGRITAHSIISSEQGKPILCSNLQLYCCSMMSLWQNDAY